jgi:hypothetical protein
MAIVPGHTHRISSSSCNKTVESLKKALRAMKLQLLLQLQRRGDGAQREAAITRPHPPPLVPSRHVK